MEIARRPTDQSRTQESWRIFCAIDLPEAARNRVERHIERLRESVPQAQASWNRKQNIHLTVKFLGELSVSRVDSLSAAAARVIRSFSPFEIHLEGSGAFPKHGPPRVLWVGVRDDSGKLAQLGSRLEEECAIEGFEKEPRPFHPHLTVARLRKPEGARALAAAHKAIDFEPFAVTVSDLRVIKSDLSSTGSIYTVISTHPMPDRG